MAPLGEAYGSPSQSIYERGIIRMPERAALCVSDVERLAKAGVKVDFESIKDQITPDTPKAETVFGQYDAFGLIRDFLRRWDRSKPDGRMPDPHSTRPGWADDFKYCFHHVSITRAPDNEDGVHVFVVTAGGKAAHLTDDRQSFPSEALMAKLIFLFKGGGT